MNDDQRFQETLQAVFGPRCAEFQPRLRELLRQLYRAAHQDGVASVFAGTVPPLEPHTEVEHFELLRPGMRIQNSYLQRQGQLRKIMAVEVMSQVVRVDTGREVTGIEEYDEQKFNTFSPYWVVSPAKSKDSAA